MVLDMLMQNMFAYCWCMLKQTHNIHINLLIELADQHQDICLDLPDIVKLIIFLLNQQLITKTILIDWFSLDP